MAMKKKSTSSKRVRLKSEGEHSKRGEVVFRPQLFPIVGIGASAGGFEAFTQMLKNLPEKTGMSFVFVQHLDPTHSSVLTEILSRTTKIPVIEVVDGMQVIPNRIHVIPANTTMVLH